MIVTSVPHGCYASKSRYKVIQHKYAAAGASVYVEYLEVADAPDGKARYIIHWYYVTQTRYPGNHTWNFDSHEHAEAAFDSFWMRRNDEPENRFNDMPGYVSYEYQQTDEEPWYYQV